MEEEIKTKVCTKCGNEKPATTEFFHKRSLGLSSYCKPCRNDFSKRYRESNPEYKKEYDRRWRKENPKYKTVRVSLLKDSYVVDTIRKQFDIPTPEITPEFIQDKREQLQNYRQLNQLLKLKKNG